MSMGPATQLRVRDLITLWARAAGRCCYPNCKAPLVVPAAGDKNILVNIGEAAHVVARRKMGPRGNDHLPMADRNGYRNLILVCPTHHNMIDKEAQLYPAERLLEWKAEHEAWVQSVTDPIRKDVPWTMIVQHEDDRTDIQEARLALGPGKRAAAVAGIRSRSAGLGWEEAARRERQELEKILAATPVERRRFAVFSMTRIPLAVHLGCLLSDRARVELYHYHRQRGSWSRPAGGQEDTNEYYWRKLAVRREWRRLRKGSGPVAIRVSLSAPVAFQDVARVVTPAVDIHIAAGQQSVYWLRRPDQLLELARVYDRTLAEIRERTISSRIHLFYAGPTAGAICFGQAYNPRMNPELQLYEYGRGRRPPYQPVLLLNASKNGD